MLADCDSLTTIDTWQPLFIAWLQETKPRDAKTIAAYLQDLRKLAEWWQMANQIEFIPTQLNPADIRAWFQYAAEVERLKPATLNRRRTTLGVLIAWIEAYTETRLFDIARVIAKTGEQETAPRWLSESEWRAIARQLEMNILGANTEQRRVRAVRDRAVVNIQRFAGLRVDEVAALEITDITLHERSGYVVVQSGKRGKKRTVPLSSGARLALQQWLDIRGAAPGVLFTDGDNRPVGKRAIQKRLALLATETRVEALTCHALRHTCAKRMLDAGRPLTEVQKILGHTKLETTARYVTPGFEDLSNAVEAGEIGQPLRQINQKRR